MNPNPTANESCQSQARRPRRAALVVAGLGAALLFATAPAMAKDDQRSGERCGATADTSWQSIAAVSQKLEAEGYTDFLRIQRARGCYEAIAHKDAERPVKLWLNPASLEVTGFSRMWHPGHGGGHHQEMRGDRHSSHEMKGMKGRAGEHRMRGSRDGSQRHQGAEQSSPAQD